MLEYMDQVGECKRFVLLSPSPICGPYTTTYWNMSMVDFAATASSKVCSIYDNTWNTLTAICGGTFLLVDTTITHTILNCLYDGTENKPLLLQLDGLYWRKFFSEVVFDLWPFTLNSNPLLDLKSITP